MTGATLILMVICCLQASALMQHVKLASRFCRQLNIHGASTREEMLADAMTMRNSALKKELNELCVNSKGVFDKHELAELLVNKRIALGGSDSTNSVSSYTSSSQQQSAKTSTGAIVVPMLDLVSSNVPGAKNYVGLELSSGGYTIRCMLDTAASTNLVKPEVPAKLGLQTRDFQQFSSGLGGQGQIASQRTSLTDMAFTSGGQTVPPIEASVLNNGAAIPPAVDALLGLPFLESLACLVILDFRTKQLRFRQGVMPANEQNRYHKVAMKRVYPTGLVVCDAVINGNSDRPVQALIDLGATYSILSRASVQSVLGKSMENLETSKAVSAGIDGQPMYMKETDLQSLALGGYQGVAVPGLKVYAADIPQLEAIGLGQGMLLLGLDVLGQFGSIGFCFKEMALYLEKRGGDEN